MLNEPMGTGQRELGSAGAIGNLRGDVDEGLTSATSISSGW